MHSFRASTEDGDTHFSFNSDMSGNVRIIRSGLEIEIPGEHLIQFVANYIRQERIAALEQAEDRHILGLAEQSN